MSEIIENQNLENNEAETANVIIETKEIATEEINQTAMDSEKSSQNTCCDVEQPKKKCCCNTCLTICNIILLLGLIGIYILHFTGIGAKNGLHNPNATEPVVVSKEGLKIAYIDSDTILANYQYAKDMEAELVKYKDSKERSYTQQMNQFQTDYQNYLKTGASLSLSQQQAKEAELK